MIKQIYTEEARTYSFIETMHARVSGVAMNQFYLRSYLDKNFLSSFTMSQTGYHVMPKQWELG